MNGFCVPFALGFISGKTPDQIAELIQEERGSSRPVRGVTPSHYLPVIAQLGFKITATVRRPGMTIRKWAANRAKWGDKSTWLINKSGHMMVYRDGVIYDNHAKAGRPADQHDFANARLQVARQVSR